MKKNKFIVFEGLDGSGKSTQIKMLHKLLTDRGEKVYITAEPSGSPSGKYLRQILSESLKKDMNLMAALFLADRIEHNTNEEDGIKKYLDDGYTVICDRYYYSSLAYQGKSGEADFKYVYDMNISCDKILKPDVCFFLDVDPKTCKNRIDSTRDNVELYEKDISYMNKTRDGFLYVIDYLKKHNDENIVVIDANDTKENISKEIIKNV